MDESEGRSHIEACGDARPYFHAQVAEAAAELGLEPTDVAAPYLAEMLTALAVERGDPRVTTPLADLLDWAMRAGDAERTLRLRRLGDVSLLICGFFPDSFERRGLSYRYVSSMGRGAYGAVDAAIEARLGAGDRSVFALLAGRFAAHVRVLDEVAERTALRASGSIAALYSRWRRSRSPQVAKRLSELGLYPQDGDEQLLH